MEGDDGRGGEGGAAGGRVVSAGGGVGAGRGPRRGWRVRVGRVLPVPRRCRGRRNRGSRGGGATGWFGRRREGDREGRRARARDGLHWRKAFSPLMMRDR